MSARRIVVTGMGAITPLGGSIAAYWDGLISGRSGMRSGEAVKLPTTIRRGSETLSAAAVGSCFSTLLEAQPANSRSPAMRPSGFESFAIPIPKLFNSFSKALRGKASRVRESGQNLPALML